MELSLAEMQKRYLELKSRMTLALEKAKRNSEEVKLIWVSKFHSAEAVENAIALGATDFGENRVQEAESKFSVKRDGIRCHIIGPVQKNKLKKAALVADCIHSISSEEALEKLEKVCAENEKVLEILFQVNAGEEETTSGLDVNEAEAFLSSLEFKRFPHLRFRGLMTIGKNTGIAEDSRSCFSFLRNLQQKFLKRGGIFSEFTELSMGMTLDLEVAIEEGATMIRVGTALFGEREYPI